MDDKIYWVALSTHQKIGARTFLKLYKRFKKLANVWQANSRELSEAGLDLGQINAVKEVIQKKNPEKEWEKLKKYQIDILIYPDENYPKILKELPDPPGILYLRGKIIPQDNLAIAVVGSRRFTPYGQRAVEKLIPPLVEKKLTIISGLALGIDALAHKAALTAKGRTLTVLPGGLDRIYPTTNIKLADQILASGGGLISEFPLGTPALKFNFPIRNRIIAGLSLGTLVIEATNDSGSLLTASAAIEYNREVFAVPGPIFSESSEGTNRLIKMGAKIVTMPEDIFEELKIEHSKTPMIISADSQEEANLLNLLSNPTSVDNLVKKSNLSTAIVNSVLLEMEMKGKVTNLGGSRYVINGKLEN